MNDDRISRLLIDRGQELFNAPKQQIIPFSQHEEADALLNNIEEFPHAFVLGCIMDRQIRAELAWVIPYHLAKKLGNFQLSTLKNLTSNKIEKLMSEPDPLHRYPKVMAGNIYTGIRLIEDKYEGNAALIWEDKPSSATVVYRFLEFRGAGPKISTMATNILARDFKVPLSDYYSIDISPDVHVKRVFKRLGLIEKDHSNDILIYRAKSINPEFPGLLDLPTWEIGRNWCRPKNPQCDQCYMNAVCPFRLEKG